MLSQGQDFFPHPLAIERICIKSRLIQALKYFNSIHVVTTIERMYTPIKDTTKIVTTGTTTLSGASTTATSVFVFVVAVFVSPVDFASVLVCTVTISIDNNIIFTCTYILYSSALLQHLNMYFQLVLAALMDFVISHSPTWFYQV